MFIVRGRAFLSRNALFFVVFPAKGQPAIRPSRQFSVINWHVNFQLLIHFLDSEAHLFERNGYHG